MTCDEFEKTVKRLYERLPRNIRERFSLEIEEAPTEWQVEEWRKNPRNMTSSFAYVSMFSPSTVVLCYWGFKSHGDWSEEHIDRVIKHEYEHVVRGLSGHHSEH